MFSSATLITILSIFGAQEHSFLPFFITFRSVASFLDNTCGETTSHQRRDWCTEPEIGQSPYKRPGGFIPSTLVKSPCRTVWVPGRSHSRLCQSVWVWIAIPVDTEDRCNIDPLFSKEGANVLSECCILMEDWPESLWFCESKTGESLCLSAMCACIINLQAISHRDPSNIPSLVTSVTDTTETRWALW